MDAPIDDDNCMHYGVAGLLEHADENTDSEAAAAKANADLDVDEDEEEDEEDDDDEEDEEVKGVNDDEIDDDGVVLDDDTAITTWIAMLCETDKFSYTLTEGHNGPPCNVIFCVPSRKRPTHRVVTDPVSAEDSCGLNGARDTAAEIEKSLTDGSGSDHRHRLRWWF